MTITSWDTRKPTPALEDLRPGFYVAIRDNEVCLCFVKDGKFYWVGDSGIGDEMPYGYFEAGFHTVHNHPLDAAWRHLWDIYTEQAR